MLDHISGHIIYPFVKKKNFFLLISPLNVTFSNLLRVNNEGKMSCEVGEVSYIGVLEWHLLRIGGPSNTAHIIDIVHLNGSH